MTNKPTEKQLKKAAEQTAKDLIHLEKLGLIKIVDSGAIFKKEC